MFAIPTPGRSVPIPGTRTLLPATGQNIGQVTQYWQRRLHEGDITLSEAPPAATPAATEAAKAASTAASPAPASAPAPALPPPELPAPPVCAFEHSQVFWSKPGAGQGIGEQGLLEPEQAAVDAAEAVDQHIETMTGTLVATIEAAGRERLLDRSLHRQAHFADLELPGGVPPSQETDPLNHE